MCKRGFTGPNGEICSKCEASKYKASVGPATCSNCPTGKFASGLLDLIFVNVCKNIFQTTISFSLNVAEQFVTIGMKKQIRQNTAEVLGIEINRISELQFGSSFQRSRRLLSIEVSFIINSDTQAQAANIQTSLDINVLNQILQSASDNFLLASNVRNTVRNSAESDIDGTVPNTTGKILENVEGGSSTSNTLDSTMLIIIISVVFVLILIIYIICSKIDNRTNGPSDFDVTNCKYCNLDSSTNLQTL